MQMSRSIMGTEAAAKFLKFVNASPTPFHAVQNAAATLEKAGFHKVCLSLRHLSYRGVRSLS